MKLTLIRCLRCQGALEVLRNGGGIYLRCETNGCGVIWPAETALADITKKEAGGFGEDPNAVEVPGGRVRPYLIEPLPDTGVEVRP